MVYFGLLFVSWIGISHPCAAQREIDSLRQLVTQAREDTSKAALLNTLGYRLSQSNPAEARHMFDQALALSEKLGFKIGIANALGNIGNIHSSQGNYDEAYAYYSRSKTIREEIRDHRGLAGSYVSFGNLAAKQGNYTSAIDFFLKAAKTYEEVGDRDNLAAAYINLGWTYRQRSDYPKAMDYYLKSLKIARDVGNKPRQASVLNNIGVLYQLQDNDSLAMEFYRESLTLREELGNKQGMLSSYTNLGEIHSTRNQKDLALEYYRKAYKLAEELGDQKNSAKVLGNIAVIQSSRGEQLQSLESHKKALEILRRVNDHPAAANTLINLGQLHLKNKNVTEAQRNIEEGLALARKVGAKETIKDGLRALAELFYARNDYVRAYDLYGQYSALKDSLLNFEKAKSMNELREKYDADRREREIELLNKDRLLQDAALSNERFLRNAFIAGFIAILIIAALVYNRYLFRKRLTRQLEDALYSVQTTQQQLIHSEKMASLGQLTAGIAHEIQNPLNFVNNFSELTVEISREVVEDILNDTDMSDAEKIEAARGVLTDIHENSLKVNHHGKRAGEIVRQMLMHSRSTPDEKSEEDVNRVLEQVIALAYIGRRAQNEQLNVEINKDFQSDLPPVQLSLQEFSRVLVNLMNNALDAVLEKQDAQTNGYQPAIDVRTRKTEKHVEIRVRDNGSGIPEDVLEKIFQPFFTTKPTGSGTGLGLSLSYDIITKGHGGYIRVESVHGEFTEFVLLLPINK